MRRLQLRPAAADGGQISSGCGRSRSEVHHLHGGHRQPDRGGYRRLHPLRLQDQRSHRPCGGGPPLPPRLQGHPRRRRPGQQSHGVQRTHEHVELQDERHLRRRNGGLSRQRGGEAGCAHRRDGRPGQLRQQSGIFLGLRGAFGNQHQQVQEPLPAGRHHRRRLPGAGTDHHVRRGGTLSRLQRGHRLSGRRGLQPGRGLLSARDHREQHRHPRIPQRHGSPRRGLPRPGIFQSQRQTGAPEAADPRGPA